MGTTANVLVGVLAAAAMAALLISPSPPLGDPGAVQTTHTADSAGAQQQHEQPATVASIAAEEISSRASAAATEEAAAPPAAEKPVCTGSPRTVLEKRLSTHSQIYACNLTADNWPVVLDEEFPLFKNAKAEQFELVPGDALYMPSEYWHWVISEEETVGVNFWVTEGTGSKRYDKPTFEPGYAAGWSGVNKWDIDFIASIHAEHIEPRIGHMSCAKHGFQVRLDDVDDAERMVVFENSDLAGFITAFRDRETYSGCEAFMRIKPNSLLLAPGADKDLHPELPPADSGITTYINLWISRGTITTGLHYDTFDNTLVLLTGKKKLLVYPPTESPNLYSPCPTDPSEDLSTEGGRKARLRRCSRWKREGEQGGGGGSRPPPKPLERKKRARRPRN